MLRSAERFRRRPHPRFPRLYSGGTNQILPPWSGGAQARQEAGRAAWKSLADRFRLANRQSAMAARLVGVRPVPCRRESITPEPGVKRRHHSLWPSASWNPRCCGLFGGRSGETPWQYLWTTSPATVSADPPSQGRPGSPEREVAGAPRWRGTLRAARCEGRPVVAVLRGPLSSRRLGGPARVGPARLQSTRLSSTWSAWSRNAGMSTWKDASIAG